MVKQGAEAAEKSVRVDKWLFVARVFKTRSQATKACDTGRVTINQQKSKPHRALRLGDRVEVTFRDWQRVLIVRGLAERPLAKKDVPALFEDLSTERPPATPSQRAARATAPRREAGAGRPTKRERRQLDKLLGA